MRTKAQFTKDHPELNEAQLKTAYLMSEISDWRLEGLTLSKNGFKMSLDSNGNVVKI